MVAASMGLASRRRRVGGAGMAVVRYRARSTFAGRVADATTEFIAGRAPHSAPGSTPPPRLRHPAPEA